MQGDVGTDTEGAGRMEEDAQLPVSCFFGGQREEEDTEKVDGEGSDALRQPGCGCCGCAVLSAPQPGVLGETPRNMCIRIGLESF